MARTIGSRYLTGVVLMSAASVQACHGDPARALWLFDEVLAHWHEVG